MRLIHKNKLKAFKTILICCAIFLVGCGGGGDSSTSTTPLITAIHVTPATQAQALLSTAGFNEITYNVSVRKPGALVAGGPSYDMTVVVPRDLATVNDTCNGQRIVYGGRCQIQVRYNGAAPHEPIRATGYVPLSYHINITATPTDGSAVLNNTTTVRVLNDPLYVNIVNHGGDYITNNIGVSGWRSPFQAPIIQTYSLGYSRAFFGDDNRTMITPLVLKTRCRNKLIYLVIQQKMQGPLDGLANHHNVTVKYHSLIGDNIVTGVAGNPRVINGQLKLIEARHREINVNTNVNAHDGLWSGPENIGRLQQLITTHTTPGNNYIVSMLSNITPNNIYIDPENQGANKIVTVHVLLEQPQYGALTAYLRIHNGLGDLVNLVNPGNATLDNVAKNSLNAYRTEVARSCAL